MRFVAVKTPEQPILRASHRMRDALVRGRAATSNQTRAFLREPG
jgi:transposase